MKTASLPNRRAAFLLLATSLTAFSLVPELLLGNDDSRNSAPLSLQPGDHICIIGNELAEGMQHDGWLETYLYARFPNHDLTIRNLGYSGDEVAGFTDHPDFTHRLRSQSFGTADQWLAGSAPVPEPNRLVTRKGVRENRFELTNTKADVIFAFFGYNESYAGEAGLPQFKKDVEAFIKHALAQKYNGKSTPRLVLFSPTAFENLGSPNLPDGKEANQRLELYSKAIGDVAAANKIPFVDLFNISRKLHKQKALTINGVHLTEYGSQLIAGQIDRALFGEPTGAQEFPLLEKIRQAVIDKNFYWFNRYRVLDGYNVYGGRAFEKYAEQQSNYEDQQRELEILDVKTANRDKAIWAIAKGEAPKIDDSNCPPLIPVKTNKPGPGPGGTHIYLDGEEAIKKMTVAKGMKVTLFASEKDFPELAKPVQMQFDAHGRLWVAVWPSYPHWKPTEEMNDKILIFEDTKGTGKADKMTVFADHLNCPTGFDFWNGGVLVAQAPDLIFLQDTKASRERQRPEKADLRLRVLHGLDSADSHHTSNSFAFDPGGALYFQEGTFHHTQVETPYGPPVRCANAGVFRYEPRTQKFDVYVTFGFANPHGHVWDRWGQDIVYDGTGAQPYHGALFSGHLDFPQKHKGPPQVYQQRTRPCPGVETLSSRHFPPEYQDNLLVANVIGFQGILRYKVEDKGASFAGIEQEPLLFSSDPNFRPSDLKIGPDGAIWFIDWQNTIIGHLQHAIRDPNRDRTHGRIYRVTYEGRPLLQSPPIAGEPIAKLLDLLKEPEERVRYRVRAELSGRNSEEVIAAVANWIKRLDPDDALYEHCMLEALWQYQSHNVVNKDLLLRELQSPEFRARAAATRVLCYWRDRVPETLDLLKKLAADPYPRVRLEAVRAASFLTVPEAVEVALISADQQPDPYIDFVRGETMRALDPIVKKAIADGRELNFTTPAGGRFFLKNVATDDLLKLKRTPAVSMELLFRKGVRDEIRRDALASLAKSENKSEIAMLVDAIRKQDEQQGNQEESVVFDLIRLLTGYKTAELAGVRGDLERLATGANMPVTRELGYVALIAADSGVDKAWSLAIRSTTALQDLVRAMPLVRDPGQRLALYPRVESLLAGLPKELAPGPQADRLVMGRYVRVELPGKQRTLTLAEVEVYSGGQNIARHGKASQKNTAHGGEAARAIDGNKSGSYGDGGQTHSQEGTADPWWEVDLGGEFPIDAVVIYNRTDDSLGSRLNDFTLRVLDTSRHVVAEKTKQPAPKTSIRYEIGSETPEHLVRRTAMNALTSVRGKEEQAFKAIAPFVGSGSTTTTSAAADNLDRHAAVQALLRIPVTYWPKDNARPLLDKLLVYVRSIPVKERTTSAALDALQLADSLTPLLPPEEARQIRKELGDLGVRVIRMATVPDQMLYDKDRIVVKAGKPFEILFENNDLMPHNLVLLQPGALEEVGTLAESTATQPGALARDYVPASPKILLKSRLLQPRESQRLSFSAPNQPGVYPYVCTYPGHWRRMYGALFVVADLDDFLGDPEGYLAKNPLPIADELLKFTRPRKEWKFEELAASVEQMDHGRSFSNGKQLFQLANCVACHKLGGVGTEIGPDLTKLDPKLKPVDHLRDILEPSFRINEKYQSYFFELQSGKLITGLILEETPDSVKVIDNPLVKAEPIILKKTDIAERKKSPTSIMPKGLLDKLTREEILDLLAYVLAGGDPNHKLFQGEHHH